MHKLLIGVSIIISLFFCVACEKTNEEIKSELRDIVRKDINKRNAALRPVLDSLCELNKAYTIRQSVDSLIKIRIEEIRKIAEQ